MPTQIQEGDVVAGYTYTPEGIFEKKQLPSSSTITSDVIAPTPTINYATPNPVPTPNVTGLNADVSVPLSLTEPETKAQDLTTRIQTLNEQLLGESSLRTKKEEEAGVPGLLKGQQDLSAQLKALQNEALAIPLQLHQEATGRGITAAGLQPIQTARLRTNAIAALGVSSLLEASRGNITLAQDLVDRAVAVKYDPIREEIAAKTKNLDLILKSPEFTVAEKNRAQAQLDAQRKREKEIAKQEADQKEVWGIANTAAKYGADPNTLRQIQGAKNPIEALALASKYLQDPKAKYELESLRLENILKQAQIAKVQKETGEIGKPSKKELEDARVAKKQAKVQIPIIEAQIKTVDDLYSHKALDSSVGPSAFTRLAFTDEFTGASQDFAGKVHKLIGDLTLDNLIKAKERGATFGALSEGELRILANAATTLSDWEVKDADGKPTGKFNVSEEAFRAELDRIKSFAQLDLQRKLEAQGFNKDEEDVFDAMWEGSDVVTVGGNESFYFE